MANYLKLARKAFRSGDFTTASALFSLSFDKQRQDAEIGVLLCDLATTDDQMAFDLFDLYSTIKRFSRSNAYKLVRSVVEESYQDTPVLIPVEHGINYQEFRDIMASDEFRGTFRDIIHSTKIVLSDKKELFSFLEELIENGHSKMALEYIDGVSSMFVGDKKVRELLEKIKKWKSVEIQSY